MENMMNERIGELAEQACFDEIGKDYSLYFNLTKDKIKTFAELLIHEVFAKMEDNGFEVYQPVKKSVMKHFGVEE